MLDTCILSSWRYVSAIQAWLKQFYYCRLWRAVIRLFHLSEGNVQLYLTNRVWFASCIGDSYSMFPSKLAYHHPGVVHGLFGFGVNALLIRLYGCLWFIRDWQKQYHSDQNLPA